MALPQNLKHFIFPFLIAALASGCYPADNSQPPLIIHNADIWTMDPSRPRAQAIAIDGNRILAVGNNEDIRALVTPQTRVLNARGRTLLPGFNDAHQHPAAVSADSVDLGPLSISNIDELIETLQVRASQIPAGEWVLGWGYDDVALGGHPTRQQLDKVSQQHPVLIRHSSGHLAAANSLVYSAAGIEAATPDPAGGSFIRDEKGEPTGVCNEPAACDLLYSDRFPEPERGLQQTIIELRETFARLHAMGVTSLGDAYVTPGLLLLYQLALNDDASMRVNLMLGEEHVALARVTHWLQQSGFFSWLLDSRIRASTIKVFHGNSLSGRTCWLFEPYADQPDYFGVPPARSQEELNALVAEIHHAGLQLAIHANGDREIDMVLTAIAQALADEPRPNHRHRIEHASILNADLLQRVGELGVVLVPHSYILEHGNKMEAYGEQRFPWMHANRAALEMGIPVAGNSDYPVSSAHVMSRIRSLMTRTSLQGKSYGSSQVLSAEQALYTYTAGSAYASFDENNKGTLAPGYLADLTMLSASPEDVPPTEVSDIDVLLTILDGRPVYQRPEVQLSWD